MRHGFLLVDKPEGPSSHDVVAAVRKRLHERKIGHLGTLDPAASGLLVLATGGKALKVVELFSDVSKEYIARVTFGAVSSTYDREGAIETVVRNPGVAVPDYTTVQNAIEDRFIGTIEQEPPAASAVKVGGERAYRKMRQGRAVDMPLRQVEIEACDIQSYDYPRLTLRVRCGSGTYIRSLAHDLGRVLKCGGYLSGLRRTRVGEWSVEDAVSPEQVRWADVTPLKEVLAGRPSLELSDSEAEAVRHGQSIDRPAGENTIAWHGGLPVAVLKPLEGGRCRARKVL